MNDIRIFDKSVPIFPETNKQNHNPENVDFRQFVKDAIYRTEERRKEANIMTEKLMVGDVGIHETMVSVTKADLSMKLMLQFRNKTMEAYKQIMQMAF